MIDDVEAARSMDRRRRLADVGYRVRWCLALAVSLYDGIILAAFSIGVDPAPPFIAIGLSASVLVAVLSPPVLEWPTEDRLAAERVLHPEALHSEPPGDRALSDR